VKRSVNQPADGHARPFLHCPIPKQDNGISAQAELHPPRSLRVHQVLSRELSHHLATNRRNAASLAPLQNTGWLLSYCDFVFLCTRLSNGKSSQLTLPFLPTPLPLLIDQIAPSPRHHRQTAVLPKKEPGPLLTGLVSSPILIFSFSTN
jgi:hypothetical protein